MRWMARQSLAASLALGLMWAGSACWAEGLKVTFTGAAPAARFGSPNIEQLLPNVGLPSDWTDYSHITFEWRSSTAQRFTVELISNDGPGGAEVVASRAVQPYENVWTWVVLPLDYFRKAPLQPESSRGVNFQEFVDTDHGSVTPVSRVTAIGFRMDDPLGTDAATLEIRNLSVGRGPTAKKPEQLQPVQPAKITDIVGPETVSTNRAFRAVLEKVVDPFGQWKLAEWEGKITSAEQLREAWTKEEEALSPGDFGYNRYGGLRGMQMKETASGFFRVQQVDGRWWLIDPEGCLFYAAGVTGMLNKGEAFTTNWKEFDLLLPRVFGLPRGATPIPNSGNTAFYEFNFITRHDPTHADFGQMLQKHHDLSLRRLNAWGINVADTPSMGTGNQRIAYVTTIDNWVFRTLNWPRADVSGPPLTFVMGMADVYSPDFEKRVESQVAEVCTSRIRTDPYLLGYQIDFGPPWIMRETMFCDQVLAGPNSELKKRLEIHLKERDTPERRREFAYTAFDRYLSLMVTAIRKHDPNHLILGVGFQQADLPEEFFRFARYFDVFSMNIYEEAPEQDFIERLNRLSGKPVLISGFGFGAIGRGMGGGPAMVADQAQRGRAYRFYAEQAAALPAVVGALWYGWVDQSALGQRGNTSMVRHIDGENYNVGIVDVTDQPYEKLVQAMVETHKRLGNIHAKNVAPTGERAERVALAGRLFRAIRGIQTER